MPDIPVFEKEKRPPPPPPVRTPGINVPAPPPPAPIRTEVAPPPPPPVEVPEATTRDVPEKIESIINQNQEVFEYTPDPKEERAKVGVALMLQYQYGVKSEYGYDSALKIGEELFGEQVQSVQEMFQRMGDEWRYQWDVAEMIKLYERQMFLGDFSEETQNAIDEMEKNLPNVDVYEGGIIEQSARGIIQQLPMYLQAAKEAGVPGLLLSAVGGLLGFYSGGPGGAALGAKAGLTIGTTIGAATGFFKYLGSNAYRDFIMVYDMDPELARIGAFIIGAWETGTELLLDFTAVKAVKTAPKMFTKTMQKAALNLVNVFGHILTTGKKEGAQELVQELGGIATQEIIKRISNATKGTEFDAITWEEEVKRMEAAITGGFLVAGGLTGAAITMNSLSQSIKDVYQNPKLVEQYRQARVAEIEGEIQRAPPVAVEEAAVTPEAEAAPEVVIPPEALAAMGKLEQLSKEELRELDIAYQRQLKQIEEVSEKEVTPAEITEAEYEKIIAAGFKDIQVAERRAETQIAIEAAEQRGREAIETTGPITEKEFSKVALETAFRDVAASGYAGKGISPIVIGYIRATISRGSLSTEQYQKALTYLNQNPQKYRTIFAEAGGYITPELLRKMGYEVFTSSEEIDAYFEKEEKFESAEEVAQYEALEAAEDKGKVVPLSQYTTKQRRLAEKATTIKGKIRAIVGKITTEKLIIEEEALKQSLTRQVKIAKAAFAAGKKTEALRVAQQRALLKEVQRQKKQRREMLSDLKKVKTDKMSPANADPIRKMLSEIDLAKPTKKTVARLERTTKYLENNPDVELPDYVIENLKRLDKKNWQDMDMEELQSVHDAILHHAHLEKTKQTIKDRLKERRFNEALEQSISEMKPRKEISQETAFKHTPIDSAVDFGKWMKATFGIRQDHYDLMVERISGANSTIDKIIYQGPKSGELVQMGKRQEYFNNFHKDQENTGVLKKIKDVYTWKKEKVKVSGIELTRGERMALYRHSLHEDNRRHLLLGGFGSKRHPTNIYSMSEKQMHDIVNSLTKEEKLFAGIPIDNFFEQTGNDTDKTFTEKNGYPMPRVEGIYYPVDVMPAGRAIEFNEEQEFAKSQGEWTKVGVPKGRLERRVKSKAPIFLNDIAYDINKHVMWASTYVGLEIPVSNASKLLYDQTFRAELRNRYGDITWEEIEKGLRDLVGDYHKYVTTDKIMMKLKNNITPAMLGLNPFVLLKQPISFGCYWPYVDVKYLAMGMEQFILHPKKISETHKIHSVEYTERAAAGYSRDVTDTLRKKAEKRLYGGKKGHKEVSMSGVQWFDKGAVIPGMQGAVLKVLDEFKAGKLSYHVKKALDMKNEDIAKLDVEEKTKLAYKYADYATERSQPMFSPLHRSSLSRGKPHEQLFTQFSAFTNTAFSLMRRSWLDLKMNPSKETMATMGKVLFSVLVANAVAVGGLDELRDWLYGRKKRSFLMRIIRAWAGYFYFVREIVQSATDKIERGTFIGADVEIPILRVPNLLTDVIANGIKGITEGDIKAFGKFFDSGGELFGVSVGIPYGPVRTMIKGLLKGPRK